MRVRMPQYCQTKHCVSDTARRIPITGHGRNMSPILIIRYSPSYDEVRHKKLWHDVSGHKFREMLNDLGVSLDDCCSSTITCCNEAHESVVPVRNCRSGVDMHLGQCKRKLLVCTGRVVVKHLFLRGAAPPSMETLSGRVVHMPETHGAGLTVIPDTKGLVLEDEEDTVEKLELRLKEMWACLKKIAPVMQEILYNRKG